MSAAWSTRSVWRTVRQPGSLEFLTDGSWAKRMHGGWAAHSGLVAARLAAAGFTGPKGSLDGRFGLYRSYLGDQGWDRVALERAVSASRGSCSTPGSSPTRVVTTTTPSPTVPRSCAASTASNRTIVERVECFIAPRQVPIVCEPESTKTTPHNDYDAKFSLHYAVASILVRGHLDIDDFTEAAIRDPAVLALAARVDRKDPDSDFPARFPAGCASNCATAGVEHREPINRGSAENPLSGEEVRAKFRTTRRGSSPRRTLTRSSMPRFSGGTADLAVLGSVLRSPD